jgi:hypothetical protein
MAAAATTDARVRADARLSYANPKTGSPAPGGAFYRGVVATHQSARRRVLLEAGGDGGDAFWGELCACACT